MTLHMLLLPMNHKFLLMCFESMCGLKINYAKTEVVIMGCDFEEQLWSVHMMNCRLDLLPIMYLGIPIDSKKLSIVDLKFLTDRVANEVDLQSLLGVSLFSLFTKIKTQ